MDSVPHTVGSSYLSTYTLVEYLIFLLISTCVVLALSPPPFLPPNSYSVLLVHIHLPGHVLRFFLIMHPLRGPKGRGVAPIGATRGVH